MSEKKTPFNKINTKQKKVNIKLSKSKIDKLLNEDLRKQYDFKMLLLNIHYKRLVLRNPAFAEFCKYTGFE